MKILKQATIAGTKIKVGDVILPGYNISPMRVKTTYFITHIRERTDRNGYKLTLRRTEDTTRGFEWITTKDDWCGRCITAPTLKQLKEKILLEAI